MAQKYLTEEERKAARRETQRRYRAKNKEKRNTYNREWLKNKKETDPEYYEAFRTKKNEKEKERYQLKKETIKEKRKDFYIQNCATITVRNKKYRESHKEDLKFYREAHKEERRVYQKEYYEKYSQTQWGRAKNLLSSYKHNDKKNNRGECTITVEWIMDNIFSKSCYYCGETDWTKLGCDRIDNSLPHTPENVVCSCWDCNNKRGTMPFEEFVKQQREMFYGE